MVTHGVLTLHTRTCISSLAIDAFLRGAADSPVPVHKEAVTQWMTEPLHGRGHAATGRQACLPGTAQEHTLSGRGEQSARLISALSFIMSVERGQNYTAYSSLMTILAQGTSVYFTSWGSIN